jgi:hypothetical protein
VPRARAQCGDASGTGVFDTAARTWDRERMRSIDPGLEHFFPQLAGPDEARPRRPAHGRSPRQPRIKTASSDGGDGGLHNMGEKGGLMQ